MKRPLKSKELEELYIMTDSEGRIYRYITEEEMLMAWTKSIEETIRLMMEAPEPLTREQAEKAVGTLIVTEKEYRERFMKEPKIRR